jgi:hypothetical protein
MLIKDEHIIGSSFQPITYGHVYLRSTSLKPSPDQRSAQGSKCITSLSVDQWQLFLFQFVRDPSNIVF